MVLPLPDQLSHILYDIGDVAGWNGCIVGHSCDVGWGLAEVVKASEHVV